MRQLDRNIVGNPFGAMQSGGGGPDDGRAAAGPQPGGHDALLEGRELVFRQVDVGKDRTITRPQSMAAQLAQLQCLAADERFFHAAHNGTATGDGAYLYAQPDYTAKT